MNPILQPKVTFEIRTVPSPALVFHVTECGNVPSFKNRKRIAGKRLITDPRVKAWMESVSDAIRLTWKSATEKAGDQTLTEQCPLSLTASIERFDDGMIDKMSATFKTTTPGIRITILQCP